MNIETSTSPKPFLIENARLISGNSHPELCRNISLITGIKMIDCDVQYFSNGEIRPIIKDTVRGKDIFIFQTGTFTTINSNKSVNDYIIELLFLVKTCKRSGAESVTVVIPCFPYAFVVDLWNSFLRTSTSA